MTDSILLNGSVYQSSIVLALYTTTCKGCFFVRVCVKYYKMNQNYVHINSRIFFKD